MAEQTDTTQREAAEQTVSYVYGIVPADVETDPEARGVGDPPSPITAVRRGEIAALVSEIRADRPLGKPDDLAAHARILDATSKEVPVLPLRFGAVLTDADAVERELLGEHHDEFHAALEELEGKAEYVLRGRYEEQAVLREIVDENDEAARLREEIRGKPADATRDQRIALGELINNAIAAKREADTRHVIDTLGELAATVNVREPTHEQDAVHIAVLAEVARQQDLEQAVGELTGEWRDRVELRLLGPLAPYDFVVTQQPQQE